MMHNSVRRVVLPGAALAVMLHGASHADPGLVANVDISQSIGFEREEAGAASSETLRGLTNLRFGLDSITRTQSFVTSLGTGVSYNDPEMPDGFKVETVNGLMLYDLRGPRSDLNFRIRYSEADIDDAVLNDYLDEEGIFVDSETGSGTRNTLDFATGLTLGRDEPLSLDLRYSYRDIGYSDTAGSGFNDTVRQAFGATAGFIISPTLSVDAVFFWREQDESGSGSIDRTTTGYGLSAAYRVTPSTTVTGSVNQTDITTNAANGNPGGLGFALGASHARPNGTIAVDYSSTETVNGTRQQGLLGRSFNFRRVDLNISAGAAKTGDLSVEPLVNLGLSYEIGPSSALTLNLSQRSVVNSDDQETVRTRFNLGYTHAINSRSSLNGNLQVASEDVISAGGDNLNTYRGSITYRYDIGGDWDFVTGYEVRRTEREIADDDSRESLFVGIAKSFSFRP